MKKTVFFLAMAALVLLLDQLTNAWITSTLRIHESFAVIGGFLNITHVRESRRRLRLSGRGFPAFRYVFFLAVTVAAIVSSSTI